MRFLSGFLFSWKIYNPPVPHTGCVHPEAVFFDVLAVLEKHLFCRFVSNADGLSKRTVDLVEWAFNAQLSFQDNLKSDFLRNSKCLK